jgi:hypothetical protein
VRNSYKIVAEHVKRRRRWTDLNSCRIYNGALLHCLRLEEDPTPQVVMQLLKLMEGAVFWGLVI